jgi:hypothetical protein
MENTGLFYDHLEYFTFIWYMLWPFVNVVVIWYFSLVLVSCVKKSGSPDLFVTPGMSEWHLHTYFHTDICVKALLHNLN